MGRSKLTSELKGDQNGRKVKGEIFIAS